MSRIGLKPIPVPPAAKVEVADGAVKVTGGKTTLSFPLPREVQVAVAGGEVRCTRTSDERKARALHGLTRALIQNMIVGVTQGFTKKLQVIGVGYTAKLIGKQVELSVGYGNKVFVD